MLLGCQRWLWLASLACIVVVLGFTITYFMQINTAFASKVVAIDQVAAMLESWLLLHNIRIALALAASVLGILAIKH